MVSGDKAPAHAARKLAVVFDGLEVLGHKDVVDLAQTAKVVATSPNLYFFRIREHATPQPLTMVVGASRAGLGLADQRSEAMLARDKLPPRFTIAELAEFEGVSPSTVRRKIALARQELFGALSDGGIYHRVRRDRERLARARADSAARHPAA